MINLALLQAAYQCLERLAIEGGASLLEIGRKSPDCRRFSGKMIDGCQ